MALAEELHQNVLVADDDDDDFFAFEIACEELSYKVLLSRVTNSDALLQVLDTQVPDILFLDIMMPRVTGTHCLKKLRAERRFDSLPIIMYSSMSNLENIDFCYREGANLYVIKPNTFQGLKQALQRILTINWKMTMYFPPVDQFVIRVQ